MPKKSRSFIFPFSNCIEPVMQRSFSSMVPSPGAGLDPTAARSAASRCENVLAANTRMPRNWRAGARSLRDTRRLCRDYSLDALRGDRHDRATFPIPAHLLPRETREDHKLSQQKTEPV